ncbi:MAG: alcohol dehydrogenase catalytic domain-containing protein [Rhodobacteraceae bacterium]|nr:alcohol dehydrogenase catalytic domain-containing protein [Paracoccaceae bacterium]
MKALTYTDVETLKYGEVPHPVPSAGEDLICIMASGICGSDMHAYLGHDARRPAPLILGHEAAGLVVGGPDEGRRVTINPLVTCGTCKACNSGRTNLCSNRQIISMPPRAGAFAEYVAMPQENLVTVPNRIPLEHAVLAEPLACGWHGVRMGLAGQSAPASELRGLAIGGGAIGFGAALSMKAQGLDDVTLVEPHPERRAFLAEHSSFAIVPPEALDPDTQFDLVVDGVGFAATRATASAVTCPGGVIVHIGLGEDTGGLDIRRMTLQEITFIGTYTYTAQDFRETAQAIFDGSFGSLHWVTSRPLSEGQQAFRDIRTGKVAAPKTILIPAHTC